MYKTKVTGNYLLNISFDFNCELSENPNEREDEDSLRDELSDAADKEVDKLITAMGNIVEEDKTKTFLSLNVDIYDTKIYY
jgi:hypothetical protein